MAENESTNRLSSDRRPRDEFRDEGELGVEVSLSNDSTGSVAAVPAAPNVSVEEAGTKTKPALTVETSHDDGESKFQSRSMGGVSPLSAAPTMVTIANSAAPAKRSLLGSAAGLVFSKYTMMGAAAYAVASTGVGGWLFRERKTLDDLSNEIDRLQTEVTRLEGQVDELSLEVDRLDGQVDRLEDQNDRLAFLNEALQGQTSLLNESVAETQQQNKILNASVQEQKQLVNQLNYGIEVAAENKEDLDNSVDSLNGIVANLEQSNVDLNSAIAEAQTLTEDLTEQNNQLRHLNANLTRTTGQLSEQIDRLEEEIGELEENADNLETVTSFLGHEAENVNRNLSSVASFLAANTQANRGVALTSIETTYIGQTLFFECSFENRWVSESFGKNSELSIGSSHYSDVLDWFDGAYLSNLCADMSDFEKFMSTSESVGYDPLGEIPPIDITQSQIGAAYSIYSVALLSYYFPDPDADENTPPGLTQEDWVNADYDCKRLPREKQFVFDRDAPPGF